MYRHELYIVKTGQEIKMCLSNHLIYGLILVILDPVTEKKYVCYNE